MEITGLPRWVGETVAILGGGPSLTPEAVDYCRGRCRVIAINRAFRLAPWADMLHAADFAFWRKHPEALAFTGAKTSRQYPCRPVIRIPMADRGWPWKNPDVPIYKGRDSGYQAVQIASLLGAARVLLLGMDARRNGWWHEGYGRALQREIFVPIIWLHRELALVMEARKTEVINCTKGSAIDAYKHAKLQDVL